MRFSVVQGLAALGGLGGSLGVAVAGVVVVLAIVAVIVMVLRNNGAARRAASGIGYDAHQGPLGQPRADYGAGPAPWAPQGGQMNAGGQPGAWQTPAQDVGGPRPGAPSPQGMNGAAWGPPSNPRWGQPEPAAPAAPAWGQPEAPAPGAWGAAPGGAPAMRNQAQGPWDAPAAAPPSGGIGGGEQGAWGQQWGGANQAPPAPAWGQPENPAPAPAWGQPEQATPAPAPAAWGQPEPAAPAWGQPEQATPAWGAAPQQQAAPAAPWDMPAPSAGGSTGAQGWGAQPAAPEPQGWGAPATPSGANWGAQPAAPAGPAWGQEAPRNTPPAPQSFDQGGYGQQFGGMDAGAAARPDSMGAAVGQRPGVIIVRQGKEPGRVFEVRGDRLTIGRSRDSDIFLEDLAVSRLHATVFREGDGSYHVRDENSANGTTVNGQRIGDHVLEEGDEIGLGQTVLAFARR